MKYIGYFQDIESSGVLFSDNIDFLKNQWYFGAKIFEADGLTKEELSKLFTPKPERGVILKWLEDNKKEVWSGGNMVQTINN